MKLEFPDIFIVKCDKDDPVSLKHTGRMMNWSDDVFNECRNAEVNSQPAKYEKRCKQTWHCWGRNITKTSPLRGFFTLPPAALPSGQHQQVRLSGDPTPNKETALPAPRFPTPPSSSTGFHFLPYMVKGSRKKEGFQAAEAQRWRKAAPLCCWGCRVSLAAPRH